MGLENDLKGSLTYIHVVLKLENYEFPSSVEHKKSTLKNMGSKTVDGSY